MGRRVWGLGCRVFGVQVVGLKRVWGVGFGAGGVDF